MKRFRWLWVVLITALISFSVFAADQRIQYTEEMVGASHPTKSDTLNRLANVEHNTDGTHKMTGGVAGDIFYHNATNLVRLALTADKKLFGNAAGTAPEWATGIKIGTFTRDTATATGTQNITGVGFKPSNILLIVSVVDTIEISWGLDNGTDRFSIGNSNVGAGFFEPSGSGVYLYQAAGVTYTGTVTTLGADGFTISWVKTGAKTGTATILYMAFR